MRHCVCKVARCLLAASVAITSLFLGTRAGAADDPYLALDKMLPELHLLYPVWKSEVVYRESTVFIEETDGKPALGRLLFEPVRVVAVKRADGAEEFKQGKDYALDPAGKGLIRPAGSRMPQIKASEMFPPKGAPRSIGRKADDPNRHLLFDNGHWFHDQQVEVTYIRKRDAWKGPTPAFAGARLAKTIAKLKNRQPVTIAVSGDSISAGYNASAYTKAPPFMPPYPDLVAAELRFLYGGQVRLANRAVGGWSATQGLGDLDNLLKEKPDLVIIAYGMNDVGGRNPAAYRSNIEAMLKRIKAANRDTDVILVSTMLGNFDWVHTSAEMFPKYREVLASLVGPGVALADLTSLWQTMMQRKRHLDVTGNGVNHPSDFGHRVYASTLVALLADPAALKVGLPRPAAEAPKNFRLPPGFNATLFAGEPDITQPIAFTFDDRGRMWVVECHSYPGWKEGIRKDRVVILEDRDGDGRADSRKVFWDQETNLTGIVLGFGGVWLCSTPNLIFVPDANGDDVPDGKPAIKLDGWDLEARHNAFTSLAWGPDGWLYGCNGILSNSKVGRPGAPPENRVAINCGVWRFHPTREVFEAYAHGTTNPWGLDFDEYGQMFITNCVIKHLFHVMPGGHYVRMFGEDMNRHSYGLMESCADHFHWGGGHWTEARGGPKHDSFGGGHAHSGAAIYLGDNFPREYRNRVFMCNIHGSRLNQDILKRSGSGYIAEHGPDFFHTDDPWFRGVAVHQGPDGALYVADWCDTGECHNYIIADRSNGRIFRVACKSPFFKGDLNDMEIPQLVAMQSSRNEWIVRHARRILQERAGKNLVKITRAPEALASMVTGTAGVPQRLRALWALYGVGGFTDEIALVCLRDPSEHLRGWAVRLALDDRTASEQVTARLIELAAKDHSLVVLLELAAGLQRLTLPQRWALAEALSPRITDAHDANLAWMLWYGVEPLAVADPNRAAKLAERANVTHLRQSIVRRIAHVAQSDPAKWTPVFELVGRVDDETRRLDYLTGLHAALAGRRRTNTPDGWPELYRRLAGSNSRPLVALATRIALVFGDPQAAKLLEGIVHDVKATDIERLDALGSLLQAKPANLPVILRQVLDVPALRVAALHGIAAVDDAQLAHLTLDRFSGFDTPAKDAVVATLLARSKTALMLLDAVNKGTIPRSVITAYHIAQLQTLNDKQVAARVAKTWGAARPSSAERLAVVQQFKSKLTPQVLATGDPRRGRALFTKNCSACHKLFDTGGNVGPELTGSQRTNLDYVLSNVIDPSAVVPRDYQMTLIQTTDGRIVNGIVEKETDHGLVVQTANESLVIPKDEIEARKATGLSMMPDGLWSTLRDDEWRDLVRYLASPGQVPMR